MQISGGTVTVTNGSSTVVASQYNDWSQAQIALQNGSPVFFSLIGLTQIPVQVSAVTSPQVSASGNWELTLVTPWTQPSTTLPAGDQYVIQKDYTANLHLPLPSGGDQNWAQFLARAFQIIDANIVGTVPGGPPPSPPSTGPGAGAISTIQVQPGTTLYISDELDIPVGIEYDVLAGGRLEVG
jgi:hypothetical protein